MRICLLKLSAIGDIVMTLPAVKTLVKEVPDLELTWVIGKDVYSLVKDVKGVKFIPVSKPKSLRDIWCARHYFSHDSYDVLLGMHASMSAHAFYPLIKAKRKIGIDKKRSRDLHGLFVSERIDYRKEHAVDMYMQFVKKVGVKTLHYDARIPLSDEDYESARLMTPEAKYFVINPFSKKKPCIWDFEKYVEVAGKIERKYGLLPVITGGPADRSYCEKLSNRLEKAYNLSGRTSLREIAAVLEGAEFVISPDTGPAHIASAMGTPVVGLFALTRPEITGPFFSQETAINKFDEAIYKLAPKRYPYRENIVRSHLEGAMSLIQVDEVIHKVDHIMEPSYREVSQSQCDAPLVQ